MRPENFGKNLKEVMKTLGMTQAELAEKTGMTRAAVSQICSGRREPSLNSICTILRVIPTTLERLCK